MPGNNSQPQSVFISYARRDGRDIANDLYEGIKAHGFHAWRDERSINPYLDFGSEIEVAIEEASYVVVCLTPSVADKRYDSYVRREIVHARRCNKPVIPLLFPDFPYNRIPLYINELTYLPVQDSQDALNALLARLLQPFTTEDVPSPVSDPFRQHVEKLLDVVLHYMRRTIGRGRELNLPSRETLDAVTTPMPVAYQSLADDPFEGPGYEEQVQDFETFPNAMQKFDFRVLLLGDPGSGKTTTLLALARDAAYARLGNPGALLPVYAPIRSWDGHKALVSWISDVTELDAEELEHQIDQQRALLLLDGLDESMMLRQEEQDAAPAAGNDSNSTMRFMEALAALPATPTVVTCRKKDYNQLTNLANKKIALNGAVTLKPLSPQAIKTYLKDIPDLWVAISPDPELVKMASTPLVLTMLMNAYHGEGSAARELVFIEGGIEERRDRVFEAVFKRRYEHEKRRSTTPLPWSLDEIYTHVGRASGAELVAEIDRYASAAIDNVDPDKVLANIPDPESWGEVFEYLRQVGGKIRVYTDILFQDRSPADDDQSQGQLYTINRATLTEALGQDLEQFIELCEALQILIRVEGATGEDDIFQFYHLLVRDYFTFAYSRGVLSRSDNIPEERVQVLGALLALGDARSLPLIRTQLDSPSQEVRKAASTALTALADTAVATYYKKELKHSDSERRHDALIGLLVLGDRAAASEVFDAIVLALDDPSSETQESAMFLLGWLGGMRAVKPLAGKLLDPDCDKMLVLGLLAYLGIRPIVSFKPEWQQALDNMPRRVMDYLLPRSVIRKRQR
jgi:hypothetical protein